MNPINQQKKKQKLSPKLDASEYECPVCMELPKGHIIQCQNGHIICNECYYKLNDLQCPTCNVKMDKKIRCIFAEKELALKMVSCDSEQCNQMIQFSHLKDHVDNHCDFTLIDCKYKPLGCDWNGYKKELNKHENQCIIDKNNTLNIVKQLNDKLNEFEVYKKMKNIMNGSKNIRTVYVDFDDLDMDKHESILSSKWSSSVSNVKFKLQIKVVKISDNSYKMYGKLKHNGFNQHNAINVSILYSGKKRNNEKYLEPLTFTLWRFENETNWKLFYPEKISQQELKKIYVRHDDSKKITFKLFA